MEWKDVLANLEVRIALASHLADYARELEVDRENMEEEYGFDFVAALKELVSHLTGSTAEPCE